MKTFFDYVEAMTGAGPALKIRLMEEAVRDLGPFEARILEGMFFQDFGC